MNILSHSVQRTEALNVVTDYYLYLLFVSRASKSYRHLVAVVVVVVVCAFSRDRD